MMCGLVLVGRDCWRLGLYARTAGPQICPEYESTPEVGVLDCRAYKGLGALRYLDLRLDPN